MNAPNQGAVTNPSDRPTVVLVDDHAMFRAGVRAEIGSSVNIVGEAATVAEAIVTIRHAKPAVVLIDVHLPDGGGPAVVGAVLPEQAQTRFLALSVSDAAEDVISVIRAGARGYVTKTISGADLIDAIRRDGDSGPAPSVDPELDQLTPREQEVLRLLARGYSYREIGGELFISIKTVETHASNVLRKLQFSSRHQLTRWAADRRLV